MTYAPLATLARLHALLWRAKVVSLRKQSTLMLAVIWLSVAAYWVFGFMVFYNILSVISRMPTIGPWLLDRLLYIFFAFLMLMLFFSNVIIGYATMFRNQETQWLLTLPVRYADVLRWKWLETMLLASWAFVFLSGPILIAYGMAQNFPWHFYAKAILLYVPFLIIPAALAILATSLLVQFIPRRVFKIMFIAGCVLALMGSFWFLGSYRYRGGGLQHLTEQFDLIMDKTQFSSNPLLPSAWIVDSLLYDDWRGVFFSCVLISNTLLLAWVMFSLSGRMFYRSWSYVHGCERTRFGWPKSVANAVFSSMERGLELFPGLSAPIRSLILKDVRTFSRDTVQWSQFAIFFGLLGIYSLNLRYVSDSLSLPFWSQLVSFMNMVACSMTLSTLTTRFVFPQFSLEGKRLWIVGLAPLSLRQVLFEKFWLSSFGSISITTTLMLISSLMLQLNGVWVAMFCGTVILMGFGLSGLAVGLGALYPNFKEDNPSKIVSSFGGTLCLVLSMTYVTACIGIEALGVQYYLHKGENAWHHFNGTLFLTYVSPALIVVLLTTIVIVWLPLQLAFRHLQDLEI